MRQKLIAGNWKMNGSAAMASSLLSEITADSSLVERMQQAINVLVIPPFPYLATAVQQLTELPISVGAQNVAATEAGAFTGEVSASMLVDCQVGYVLVGHSERRSLFAETDQDVLEKTQVSLAAGLKVIVCVGETLEQRQGGNAEAVVGRQLQSLVDVLTAEQWQNVVIAYEPVWAIGTGETATPEQAQSMHFAIRNMLMPISKETAAATQILYGGSMNAANAEQLLAQPDIDGGLIGGASLKSADFCKIIDIACR